MRNVLLGIGNILMEDEGVGVHAVKYIDKHYTFDPHLEIIDGGTLGLEIMYMLQDGVDNLIVIDAIMGNKAPGHIYVFKNEEVRKYYFKNKLSAHEIGFSEVLALLDTIQKPVKDNLILVGIEPMSFEVSLELHPKTQERLPILIDTALNEISSLGIKAFKKE